MQFGSTPRIRPTERIYNRPIIGITKHPPARSLLLSVVSFYSIYNRPFPAKLHTDTTSGQAYPQLLSVP